MAFVLYSIISMAQKQIECGTKAPAIPLRFSKERIEQERMSPNSTYPLIMKVIVHIISNDDGSNMAAPDTAVLRQMENMRQFYSPHNICFILAGINHINSTDLNVQDTDMEEVELIPFLVPNMMNIFVHSSVFDAEGGLNGIAYGIPNWYLSIAGSAVISTTNLSTMAHEMGHDFGLYHTFEDAFGDENVARSGSCKNCDTNGDLLCDTEADRKVDGDMISATNCTYIGSLKDECDASLQMTPTNVMTYGRRSCRNHFTAGQGIRARLTIESTGALISAIAPDALTLTSNANFTSGQQFFLSRNSITISSASYVIGGSTNARMSSNVVTFNPGVTISPSGSGYTHAWINTLCQ